MLPIRLIEGKYNTANPTEVVLSDERPREDLEGFISITTEHKDESWGVFLTRDQAFAMWAWLYGILYGEPKWNDDGFGRTIREQVNRGQ